ncbi:MAG: MFS transporter [Gaiellaceae bacterium]
MSSVHPPLGRNRDFVALWVGGAISNLGISISSFAYPVVVLGATDSAAKAGLVGSVLTATTFVVRLPAGALTDRWNRRRLMVACDAGRAAASASLALALALGRFHLWHVLLVACAEGSLGTLFGPSESAAVRLVVAPDQRREAVARNASRGQLPSVIGPPLGGVLLSAGRALPFLADALSYLVSLVAILTVRTPLREPAADREAATGGIFEGIRWIWRHSFLRALVVWMSLETLVFGGIGLVIVVLARDAGASARELGVLFAITGTGSVAGAFATPWLLRAVAPWTLVVGFSWIFTAATALLLAVQSPYLIGLIGAAAFFLVPSLGSLLLASIAEEAPDRLQGRAVAGALQVAMLAAPVAPLCAGVLAEALGPRRTIAVYAGFLLLLALGASVRSRASRAPLGR